MRKSTIIILVVFVALAAVAFVVKRKPAERGITRLTLPKVDAKDADALTVTGAMPVELKRTGDVWALADGRDADQAAVTRAFESAAKLQSSDLIARGSEHYAAYEVDDAKGAHVVISKNGKAQSDFIVGKSLSNGTAVRVGDDIYAVKGVNAGTFAKTVTSWLDRRVFTEPVADATKVEVRLAGETPYTLTKNGDAWALEGAVPEAFKLDTAVAQSFVASLIGLRAKDVLAKADTVTGDEDVYVVTWKEGATTTLHVSRTAAEADGLHARVDGKDRTWVVTEGTMTSMRKKVGDLRDASVMRFESAKAQGLVIIDGATKNVFAKKDGAWTLVSTTEKKPDGFILDPQAVERRVTQLASSKGIHIVDNAGDAGLAASKTRVSVKLDGAPEATLVFGATAKEDTRDIVYARGNTGNVIAVAPYMKTNLTGGLSSFAKRAQPENEADTLSKLDPSALQGLPPDVRAGLMKQIEQKRRESEMMKRIQAKQQPTPSP